MPRLGAHLSIAGGYDKALTKISQIGGNCLQIFSSSPRGWNMAQVNPITAEQFILLKKQLNIDPVYFHASYLINLADKERVGEMSIKSLVCELKVASQIGVKGSIIHLGSFKNNLVGGLPLGIDHLYDNLVVNIKLILDQTPKNTLFIIENSGNKKIGKDLAEIATIIDQVNDSRVRVCLDTCHLYSAGYDLSSPKKFDDFLVAVDSLIGLEKIEVIHCNDSRDPFDSGRDRHENIGNGTVPIDTFKNLLNHPKTHNLSYIIETPGFDNMGPDKKNLDILKKLIKK